MEAPTAVVKEAPTAVVKEAPTAVVEEAPIVVTAPGAEEATLAAAVAPVTGVGAPVSELDVTGLMTF